MVGSSKSQTQNPQPRRLFAHFPKSLSAYLTRLFPTAHPESWILLIVLLVNVLLVSPKLMPRFNEINPYDEAKYVESGWLLLRGEIRGLSWGPLVAVFYAPVHLVVGDSPDWFMIEAWVGRYLLFLCLWLSLVYLAYQVKDLASPLITAGLLFVTLPLFLIIKNQSDAVFVSLSVLSIANLVAYARYQHLKNLGLASVFVGLGVLARVETVVLIGTLAVLTLAIGWKQKPRLKILAISILPAVAILAGLSLVNLARYGDLNLHISSKSYESFEMNQSVLTGGDKEKARLEARRLFGTQEENNSSVVRAILRNPRAFGLRIWANLKGVPGSYFYFFGKTQGFLLLFFSAWGVYILLRRRRYALLLILLVWPLHAVIPLGFLARHIIPQTYYLPMILSAIGIAGAFDLNLRAFERIALLILAFLCCIYSWIDHKPAFLHGTILITAIFGLAWLFQVRWQSSGTVRLASMMLLLVAGMILRSPYAFPEYKPLGKASDELAVHYLQKTLPVRAKVLVPFPSPAVAAKMVDIISTSVPEDIETPQALWKWLTRQDIRAAFTDDRYSISQNVFALLETGLGHYFELGFKSTDSVVKVYLVKDKVNQ